MFDPSLNNAIKLVKIGFNDMENHNATYVEYERIFLKVGDHSPSEEAVIWLRQQPPDKIYFGWDGNSYPKYKLSPILVGP